MEDEPRRPQTEDLAGAWRRDAGGISAGDHATLDAVLADVLAHYDEPHRHYHTRAHAAVVVETIDALLHEDPLASRVDDPAALRLAGWLHDVIYDPTRHDNEVASAAYARERLAEMGVPQATIDETARLILLTAGHLVDDDDAAGRLLVDADLAILGAPADVYDTYAADIRAEYAHVPDAAYRAGRAAVLESFLARTALFHGSMAGGLDAHARANLARELAALRTAAAS